jgi:hypothetical protein
VSKPGSYIEAARNRFAQLVPFLRYSRLRSYAYQTYQGYWASSKKLRSLISVTRWGLFNAKQALRSARESVSISRQILILILGQLVIAALIISILGLSARALADRGVLSALWKQPSHPSAYANLLATVIQVAGVFLGLYFTAVSFVASTIYARVPADIRSVLMQERVGNFYIKVVALLGATATVLLAIYSLGFPSFNLYLIFTAIMAILAILSFVILGFRVFKFFDPAALVDFLAGDILRSIRGATPSGFGWADHSFQAYYQRQAERSLETYGNIVRVASAKKAVTGQTSLSLTQRLFRLLRAYGKYKIEVPTESYWFKRRNEHPNWFTSESAALTLALSSGTPLQPIAAPDSFWFEDSALKILAKLFGTLLEASEAPNLLSLVDSLRQCMDDLSEFGGVFEAVRLIKGLIPQMEPYLARKEPSPEAPEELSFHVAAVDAWCSVRISLLLGWSRGVTKRTARSFGRVLDLLDWRSGKAIYRAGFPRLVVEQLEYLLPRLQFEQTAEGRIVSPPWYRLQLAAAAYLRYVSESLLEMMSQVERGFAEESEGFVSSKRYISAAQVIQRGLEMCEKLAFHLGKIREVVDSFEIFRRVSDLPWPVIDWSDLGRRSDAVRTRLLNSLARVAPFLATLPRSPALPDYFGQAYSVLAQETYGAMAMRRSALFDTLFPVLSSMTIVAYEKLKSLTELDEETRLFLSAEPLADLFSISGFAIIYSELDGGSFWTTARTWWDSYLGEIPAPDQVLQFFATVRDFRHSRLRLLPRDTIRTSWQQDLAARLRERGVPDDFLPPLQRLSAGPGYAQASPIIRLLVRTGRALIVDPEDLFFAVYVSSWRGMEEHLPRRAASLLRALRRDGFGEPRRNPEPES